MRKEKSYGSDHKSREISMLEKMIIRMSLAYISATTNYFSEDNAIGIGQIGKIYKAKLPNGWLLAVKKLHDSIYLEEPFMFELKTLIRLRHNNIVQLLGFCFEYKKMFIAYEYLPNGKLYDRLHPAEGEPIIVMGWPSRVKIAIGIARGLAWLHHNFEIVHLDISTKCILLDQNFEPKLSNFREAMYLNSNDSTGSSCVSREFWQLDFVKDDVHSFGLLLLELITGMEPGEIRISLNSSDGTLNECITRLSDGFSGLYEDIIDKSLTRRGFNGEIFQILKAASQCVQPFPDQRPTMLQVYNLLGAVGESHGIANTSENDGNVCIEGEITEVQ